MPPVTTVQPGYTHHTRTGRRYSSIADAAAYYGCEHKLIRRLIADGTLKGYRLPGSKLIRVDLDELDSLAGGDAA